MKGRIPGVTGLSRRLSRSSQPSASPKGPNNKARSPGANAQLHFLTLMLLRHAESEMSVLIVEDEWVILEDIAQYFVSAGWSVLEAHNGEEAIAVLANGHSIDVVVTDIRLTGAVNGWDVAEAFIKNRPLGRVVYTSGNSLESARTVSNSVFIRKPYLLEDVLIAAGG
jgi:CheY-like chemotaxis protein